MMSYCDYSEKEIKKIKLESPRKPFHKSEQELDIIATESKYRYERIEAIKEMKNRDNLINIMLSDDNHFVKYIFYKRLNSLYPNDKKVQIAINYAKEQNIIYDLSEMELRREEYYLEDEKIRVLTKQ